MLMRDRGRSLSTTGAALAVLAAIALCPTPATARESLGVFEGWAAFRDAAVPRCYAIAMANPSTRERQYQPYASVGTWPGRKVRGQVHFRLSRDLAKGARVTAIINAKRFQLAGSGNNAWAQDRTMDAAIVAALRSGNRLHINAVDARGRRFSNSYELGGIATALDAASAGCARL